jgi:hypothetical protein
MAVKMMLGSISKTGIEQESIGECFLFFSFMLLCHHGFGNAYMTLA